MNPLAWRLFDWTAFVTLARLEEVIAGPVVWRWRGSCCALLRGTVQAVFFIASLGLPVSAQAVDEFSADRGSSPHTDGGTAVTDPAWGGATQHDAGGLKEGWLNQEWLGQLQPSPPSSTRQRTRPRCASKTKGIVIGAVAGAVSASTFGAWLSQEVNGHIDAGVAGNFSVVGAGVWSLVGWVGYS